MDPHGDYEIEFFANELRDKHGVPEWAAQSTFFDQVVILSPPRLKNDQITKVQKIGRDEYEGKLNVPLTFIITANENDFKRLSVEEKQRISVGEEIPNVELWKYIIPESFPITIHDKRGTPMGAGVYGTKKVVSINPSAERPTTFPVGKIPLLSSRPSYNHLGGRRKKNGKKTLKKRKLKKTRRHH